MNNLCRFVFVISFLMIAHPAFAVTALKGLATVKLVSKQVDIELEQATIVEGSSAFFQGLDDLGGEVFEATFEPEAVYFSIRGQVFESKKQSLKKILSLPLTRDEFIAILKHERTESFDDVCDCGDGSKWQHKKYPKLTVDFSDYALVNHVEKFPRHVRVEYKKNLFDLQWKTLETK